MIEHIDITGLSIDPQVCKSIIAHLQLENPFGLRSKFGNVMLFIPHKRSTVSLHKLGITFTVWENDEQLEKLIKVALVGHREFLNESRLQDNGKVQEYLSSERRKSEMKAMNEKRLRKQLGDKYPKREDEIQE